MLTPRWGQRSLSGRALALLGLFAFFLFLPGRASTPPFDRDEPRYMEATAQMLESGNFVDVRFQDKPRYLQPAGIYWLEAASVAATGTLKSRAVWAYRLPSLLAMTASVVLTAWMASVLFGATAGLGAGMLLMVSVLVTAENRMGTIDSTLLLTVLLAQAGLLRALCDREAGRVTPVKTALLYWGAIGCGLMLKGPVILIPSLATPLCLAAVERNFSLWRRLRPVWGWLVSLAILLPWCVAIGVVSHGEFFRRAVGTNFLGKVASGQQAHGLPPGYHLLVFLIAFWPGSFFAAAALPAVWKNRALLPVKYLLCWIIPHWVVFEAIATKLPHYVLPTYPAIAILTAGMLAQGSPVWAGWPRALWARFGLGVYGVLWAVAGVALALAGPLLLWKLEHVVSPAALILTAGSLPLLGLSIFFIWRSELRKALLTSAACAMLLYTGLFLVVVPRLQSIWLAPRLTALAQSHHPCAEMDVSSVSFSEPSLVFLMGGKVHLEGPEDAARRMLGNESCAVALVDVQKSEAFLASLGPARSRVRTYGSVTGVNYSNGHHLTISLYGFGQ
ncbi:ArnT family glycosyltransferase [Acetobacter orleanensis]|uniref:Glycosyl transferase n=1 Tax=Acetobacter orleanensis TaxID=104099 RepID=A0A4Y3TQU1_9PROT|nr:glycosyltransferase family 39 protein [Acetobacter orleanensis]KXV62733.1 glycosyl transferase [Acetobacter orleanensis]PCD79253.1 glycosyl transferase [Acetobacter orleanensis]GAN67865.1 glycosyl transferase [Acetobacter orleanensis JCM 7639]GBR23770.1 glycosyltransferase [Acetobacter orleanensis NRIC 0473]GEB83457.1 glycosyl transferase [Acetobacter orleanensis]